MKNIQIIIISFRHGPWMNSWVWNQFEELYSNPLSKEQALSLIKKIEYDQNIKEKFYKELDEYLYDKYETFASNPLLLTIMLLTFRKAECQFQTN